MPSICAPQSYEINGSFDEVEKAAKEVNKKATGDDDVPADVLRLLGETWSQTMTQLMYNIYETGEWSMDFIEVTVIASQKNPKAAIWSNHGTAAARLTTHELKIVARVFISGRVEKETEDVIVHDQFEFKKGRGTRDAAGMPE